MGLAVQLQLEQRAGDRRDVAIPATIRKTGAPIDVEIENLSVTGFRASLNSILKEGDSVSIGAAWLGRRTARVVWAMHPRYGFAFDAPLQTSDVLAAKAIENVEPLGNIAFPPEQDAAPLVERPVRLGVVRSVALATAETFIAIGEGLRRRVVS
ncbi:PilZ domain-containing protein [Novosphingobium mangrovi (ex Huang et al. 2023)]|uniref:PilZ domain-containing protein n=1 Tax=Novosphingobium mangrovi (ex Huang et al. 2023) TaxID=2976432 RepID=A0ABT2I0Q3_9SPHN|nr:PilZ domain-containing protein [Novosphingobium mangrovi (ex Huang et al. 2023)]MCT2398384.1 PilZ domain-containing protein [Novosphingobium mangrovi (ex Huang et al. 2023)]